MRTASQQSDHTSEGHGEIIPRFLSPASSLATHTWFQIRKFRLFTFNSGADASTASVVL
jgi:hypothetical protein